MRCDYPKRWDDLVAKLRGCACQRLERAWIQITLHPSRCGDKAGQYFCRESIRREARSSYGPCHPCVKQTYPSQYGSMASTNCTAPPGRRTIPILMIHMTTMTRRLTITRTVLYVRGYGTRRSAANLYVVRQAASRPALREEPVHPCRRG